MSTPWFFFDSPRCVRYLLAFMKLLERAELICRRRGMSGRTADVYGQWIRRFLAFAAVAHGRWVPPEQLGTPDVELFLNHLVGERRLAASTQNQALNALGVLVQARARERYRARSPREV